MDPTYGRDGAHPTALGARAREEPEAQRKDGDAEPVTPHKHDSSQGPALASAGSDRYRVSSGRAHAFR